MGEILNPHKLEIWDPEEDYDVLKLNANFQKINGAIPSLSVANSTYSTTTADFRGTRFFRLASGDKGLVIAQIYGKLLLNYSVSVPANTQTPIYFNDAIVPLNMRPKSQVGLVTGGVFSNEDKGDNLQVLMATTGAIGIRSHGAAFTRTSAGALVFRWQTAYEWNGVV